MMLLTRYGLREWLAITIVALLLAAMLWLFTPWWTALIVLGLWAAAVSFFRDPIRTVPDNLPEGVMVSPADGTVTAVETVDHHASTNGPATIVRIFLSVLDVHINRSPHDGEIIALKYTRGKFLDARTEESARVNESNLITMRLPNDETIGVRQVSGKVARRIVCPLKAGDRLRRGERFGMIKFGSTTELILPRPDDVRVHVQKGEKVRGGLTLLATLKMGDEEQSEKTRSVEMAS